MSIVGEAQRGDPVGIAYLLISGSLSFLFALAFRDTVNNIIEESFGAQQSITAQIIYTILVFVVSVIVILLMSRWLATRQAK